MIKTSRSNHFKRKNLAPKLGKIVFDLDKDFNSILKNFI